MAHFCKRAILIDVAFWQVSNNPPSSTSVVDAMKFLISLNSTCTCPFSGDISCISMLDFCPRGKYPPALLCAYGSDM